MKYYAEGYNVEAIIKFADRDGNPVVPTAVKAVLYDGEDQEVVDFGSLPFDPSLGEKSIIVPSAFNKLQNNELQAARILRIELVTSSGSIFQSLAYVIEAEQRLVIMNNSFQTYEAAMLEARNMPNMNGWQSAIEEQQKAALIESFRRLTVIPMRYSYLDMDGRPLPMEYIITANAWGDIKRDQFDEFPTYFRRALRRAQLIEANELLQGDTIARKRRNGIVTEKIGESWLTLNASMPDYGLSSQTLSALTGFIYYRMTIARG